VTVYERADKVGGLLYYGIPNMKLDKGVVARRVKLMEDEGVTFCTGVEIGKDIDAGDLKEQNDAVLFATGATWPRDLKLPGREAERVAFAMSYLTSATKCVDKGLTDEAINEHMAGLNPAGKHIVVIGGGDTGKDCIGTSVRMGAVSVTNLELLPQPPETRARDNPWPQFARIFRTDYGHTEVTDRFGKDPRRYCTTTKEFVKNEEGKLVALKIAQVDWQKDASGKWNMALVPGSEEEIPCDICLLAMGFLGPEDHASQSLGLERDGRSNIKADWEGPKSFQTSVEKVWSSGDCRRGQSLVVHAINEGRRAAAALDLHLQGNTRLAWAGGIAQRSWTAHKTYAEGKKAIAAPAA
jgi:glutamate synthase (NADPH/NADH)